MALMFYMRVLSKKDANLENLDKYLFYLKKT